MGNDGELTMKILLTGFEPFGGSDINPSEQVVKTLAQDPPPGIQLTTAILPVDKENGPAHLLHTIQEHSPQAVLALGEARSRAVITIERVGLNLMDYSIPDNQGNQITDQPIIKDGSAAYFTTLPTRAIKDALQKAGIPAQLSLSAGAFLCNQVIYTMLHYLSHHSPQTPAGFIHLPSLPQQIATDQPPIPSMHLDTMTQAISIALQTLTQ
jgi:pyroglutamyl-peptidase